MTPTRSDPRPAARPSQEGDGLFSFPDPVNEISARLVAGGVVVMTATYLLTAWSPLLIVIAYGFVARVATGPTLSPLGTFVTKVVTPRLGLEPRLVPGPPKRFAQGIGATLSVTAAVAWFGFGSSTVAFVLVAMILVAASLEAFAGFCLGCLIFGWLMRVGLVPETVCEACNDFRSRPPIAA